MWWSNRERNLLIIHMFGKNSNCKKGNTETATVTDFLCFILQIFKECKHVVIGYTKMYSSLLLKGP